MNILPLRRLTFTQYNHIYPSFPPRRYFASTQQKNGKLKTFMRKYGYVGVGVYLGFSVIDLGLTMAAIRIKGADKVEQLEHWVVTKVKTSLGMEPPPVFTPSIQQPRPSWTSIFVLAYGIHKTVLLPVRLSLTAAVTPAVAKKLASLGWIRRQSLPKSR
ncbi:uncharacterized protein BX664DRAFT_322127 [Halteromyces radiatus]|uniref:uncharacterized protein n=1 Tax=Halteromyces radiatus TaxID=101107 RepID=UPI00221F1B70|nr:uncharacterized protein BX664DRAFT_322127 [Halteromyces radiatus]KAI8099793.1 hypothetical protein BX664DRAFT_322127 [Halteromyces radiatus]